MSSKESLGLYFRPGAHDHRIVERLLAENISEFSGLVLDACYAKYHAEIRIESAKRAVDTVLDPRVMELALPGGRNRKVLQLPWALDHIHSAADFDGNSTVLNQIAEYVVRNEYTSVLAPSHYLADEADPWLHTDIESTVRLRELLDKRGGVDVQIHYPLALPSSVFYKEEASDYLNGLLAGVPVQSIWLRVHPFGSAAGPRALRNYIEACRRMHSLGVPLVAERTGVIGLSLLAFGAVGGIESGITLGERFNVSDLLRIRPDSKGFSLAARVYLANIGAFITRKDAEPFFEKGQNKAHFGCKNPECCPKGPRDMIKDPRRHFLISRIGEIQKLGRVPESIRTTLYMDEFLRPATDLAQRAERGLPKLGALRKRLEAWRFVLSKIPPLQAGVSASKVPTRRNVRAALRPTSLRH